MTIYYFGTVSLEQDRMAPLIIDMIAPMHPNIVFRHTDPTEQWWQGEAAPFLIDTVVGLKTVTIFTSLADFETQHARVTPHDYDLSMELAFLLKLKKIHTFTLVGVPEKGKEKDIARKVSAAIFSLCAA